MVFNILKNDNGLTQLMSSFFADTIFIPEADLDLKLRTLKDFHLESSDVVVHGPAVVSCSAAMLHTSAITPSPGVAVATSGPYEVIGWVCCLSKRQTQRQAVGGTHIYHWIIETKEHRHRDKQLEAHTFTTGSLTLKNTDTETGSWRHTHLPLDR